MLRTFLKGFALVAGLGLLALFLQTQGFFDRQIGNLEPEYEQGLKTSIPQETVQSGSYYAVRRSADGQFYVEAWVNGDPVTMMVDTGATYVVLSRETASSLGFDFWDEDFTMAVSIANGDNMAVAPVVLDEMELGDGVIAYSVRAVVTKEGDIDLLGMSFLRQIGGFSATNDEMVFEAR